MTTATIEPEQLHRIRDRLGHRAWSEISLEQLAGAIGVSRMTLHRRGVTKEALRLALGELLEDEFRAAALPALSAPGPADERLELALEALCEVDERYLGLLEALGEEKNPIFHEEGEGEVLTKGSLTAALRRILEDGGREGLLEPGPDHEETATLVFNACGWTYRHLRSGHHWKPERARRRVVELLVAGVRSR